MDRITDISTRYTEVGQSRVPVNPQCLYVLYGNRVNAIRQLRGYDRRNTLLSNQISSVFYIPVSIRVSARTYQNVIFINATG